MNTVIETCNKWLRQYEITHLPLFIVFLELGGLLAAMENASAENLSFNESIQFRCNKNLGAYLSKEVLPGMCVANNDL